VVKAMGNNGNRSDNGSGHSHGQGLEFIISLISADGGLIAAIPGALTFK
jgi:hypothetical protein